MIVCICKAVNDRAIRRAVAEGVETFDDLQFELGVGTCCGKCVETACEVLFDARLEAQARPAHGTPVHTSPLHFIARASNREVALA